MKKIRNIFLTICVICTAMLSTYGVWQIVTTWNEWQATSNASATEWVVDEEVVISPVSVVSETKIDITTGSTSNVADVDRLIARCTPRLDWRIRALYAKFIYKFSKMYDVTPETVCAVIDTESDWNPVAWSSRKGEGLGQIVRKWHKKRIESYGVSVDRICDVDINIRATCHYLSELFERFDRPDLALAAYNAGPSKVGKLGRVPNIKETKDFVNDVLVLIGKLNIPRKR